MAVFALPERCEHAHWEGDQVTEDPGTERESAAVLLAANGRGLRGGGGDIPEEEEEVSEEERRVWVRLWSRNPRRCPRGYRTGIETGSVRIRRNQRQLLASAVRSRDRGAYAYPTHAEASLVQALLPIAKTLAGRNSRPCRRPRHASGFSRWFSTLQTGLTSSLFGIERDA